MKTRYIILLLLAFACVSCNKTKRILKQAQYGEKGWEYILDSYSDSKKFKLKACEYFPNELLSQHPAFASFEGISTCRYVINYNKEDYNILVLFKNGEPRFIYDKYDENDRYLDLKVRAAWEGKSVYQKAIEERETWDFIQRHSHF